MELLTVKAHADRIQTEKHATGYKPVTLSPPTCLLLYLIITIRHHHQESK